MSLAKIVDDDESNKKLAAAKTSGGDSKPKRYMKVLDEDTFISVSGK